MASKAVLEQQNRLSALIGAVARPADPVRGEFKDMGRVIRKLANRRDVTILLVEQQDDVRSRWLANKSLVMECGEFIALVQGQDMEAKGV